MESLTLPKLSFLQFYAHQATLALTFFFCITSPSLAARLEPQAKGSDTEFVKTSCKVTMYPDICYQSLSAYASSIQTNPRELANTALSVTLNSAQSTSTLVLKLSKEHRLTRGEAAAIADCVETMSEMRPLTTKVTLEEVQKIVFVMALMKALGYYGLQDNHFGEECVREREMIIRCEKMLPTKKREAELAARKRRRKRYDKSIRDVVELEVGNYIYVVRIVEAGFTDNSSIKVIVDKDRTPQKQRNFSTSEGSSSSDSRSPVNGDTERSQEIEESLKTCYLGTHPNHDKEDFALGNASSLENQEINWAEHLFKNKRAHEEKGEVRAGKASFENSVGKDLSALEEGEADNKETGLFSNHSKALSNVNNPSETLEGQNVIADRSLGEKRDTRLPIRIAREEAQQVEQGEEEPFSSLDRDENWSKAERVFFPELVLKKSTKKRYGSLKQIQDKSISEKERKRRDRASRKEKQFTTGEEVSELSGRSLSESDLINHKETLLKRAKRTLALGKCLGVDIEGNEEGALNELGLCEEMEWSLVWGSVEDSGLGLKDLYQQNRVFMMKDTPLAVECLLHEGPVLTNVTSSVNAAGKWDGSQLTRALPVHYLCLISVVQPPNMALGDDSGGVSLGRTTTCSLLD
ncbi:hypothetical protein V6N11_008475 [Hibiscus sabdariffa]|uniref:Pectinesterase inhibitor domain-containing protein n=1 Tax=Hibiscus sabdariffa TaxID=183260 RepID=A0ABR1ZYT0_9ROSI